MLLALLLSQLLGITGLGGPATDKKQEQAIKDLRANVAIAVTGGSERNKRAVKTVEAMGREVREFNDRFNDSTSELARLISRHDAPRDELTGIIVQLDKYGDEAMDTLLKQRFQLKSAMTRKQWNTVFRESGGRPLAS